MINTNSKFYENVLFFSTYTPGNTEGKETSLATYGTNPERPSGSREPDSKPLSTYGSTGGKRKRPIGSNGSAGNNRLPPYGRAPTYHSGYFEKFDVFCLSLS